MIFIDIHVAAIGACACNVFQALLSKGLGTRLASVHAPPPPFFKSWIHPWEVVSKPSLHAHISI